MKLWASALVLMSVFCTVGLAAKGPEVDFVDSKLTINAEAVPLGRLIQLVDQATGMASKVPPELANRNISVRFSGLPLSDAVRKIFQGQPLDYVVIQGKSIIVTGTSQATTGGAVAGTDSFNTFNAPQPVQNFEQPTFQDFTNNNQQFPPQPQVQQQQAQPAMVQTPFGPIPNPRAQQQPPPGVNAVPQQNSLFPQSNQPFGQAPTNVPGAVPGGLPTFGTPSTFGNPSAPGANPNNSLFGNLPGTQQR